MLSELPDGCSALVLAIEHLWAVPLRDAVRDAGGIVIGKTIESGLIAAELRAQGIPGIAVPGTRALTMHIRERGAMRAAVSTVEDDPRRLLERVLASPGMTGADLARIVTTPHPYTVTPPKGTKTRYRVAAIDLGIKFGPKLLVAILILVAGYYVGRWVGALFDRWLGKLRLEPPVRLPRVRLAPPPGSGPPLAGAAQKGCSARSLPCSFFFSTFSPPP